MLIVAFAAAFAGDSMFPDETDFRVLTPLPVTRGVRVLGEAARRRLVPRPRDRRRLAGAAGAVHGDQRRAACRAHMGGSRSLVTSGVSMAGLALRGDGGDGGPGRRSSCARPGPVSAADGRRRAHRHAVRGRPAAAAGRPPARPGTRFRAPNPRSCILAPPAWFVGLQRVGLGVADGYDSQPGARRPGGAGR